MVGFMKFVISKTLTYQTTQVDFKNIVKNNKITFFYNKTNIKRLVMP